MKGRKRKTTAALRLAGSERLKFRVDEPQFQGTPRRPDWLSKYAAEVWDRVVPDLIEQGVTKRVDQDALCAYCEAAADLRRATETLEAEGMTIQGRGSTLKHPAIAIRNEAMQLLARYAAEFGMTGASRSKVKAEKPKDDAGKGRFFGGEQAAS